MEFFPEEGKYHMDGHRKCGVRLDPAQTRQAGERCPACGGKLTVGVMHRIEDLADRRHPEPPASAGEVTSLVPLAEVLGECLGRGPATKTVTRAYDDVLEKLGPELHVLCEAPLEDIRRSSTPRVAEAISRLRRGKVIREPGYDGQYGRIRLFGDDER